MTGCPVEVVLGGAATTLVVGRAAAVVVEPDVGIEGAVDVDAVDDGGNVGVAVVWAPADVVLDNGGAVPAEELGPPDAAAGVAVDERDDAVVALAEDAGGRSIEDAVVRRSSVPRAWAITSTLAVEPQPAAPIASTAPRYHERRTLIDGLMSRDRMNGAPVMLGLAGGYTCRGDGHPLDPCI